MRRRREAEHHYSCALSRQQQRWGVGWMGVEIEPKKTSQIDGVLETSKKQKRNVGLVNGFCFSSQYLFVSSKVAKSRAKKFCILIVY